MPDASAIAAMMKYNEALQKAGVRLAIDEMNCVRKHLSAIKGGRLAKACAPARVVTLLVSDVPGDSPAVIGSGPTVPDPTTCADALAVLDCYAIAVPSRIRARLERGELETPKPGDAAFAANVVQLIATPQQPLDAAAAAARAAGVEAHILGHEIEGESREDGKVHAALARKVARRGQPFSRPCVVLSGGETTVTVRPQEGEPGRGGRATEFLLGCAIALQGEPGVHVLAADTDGIDGSENNADAVVAPDSLARAAALGLLPRSFLDRNDACGFFDALGDLVVTGPTFTNVNDFRAMLIRRSTERQPARRCMAGPARRQPMRGEAAAAAHELATADRRHNHGHAVVVAVRARVQQLQLAGALRQAHALHVVFGRTILGLDAPLHALAHRVGFAPHLERALSRGGWVFAIHLPGALGHRGRRRPVGEDNASVGGALLIDLRRSGRVGGKNPAAGAQEQRAEREREGRQGADVGVHGHPDRRRAIGRLLLLCHRSAFPVCPGACKDAVLVPSGLAELLAAP